jgi:flavorubredoxin
MRELQNGVYWLNECYDTGSAHEHVSVYLIHDQTHDSNVLIDSGSFYHRDALTSQLTKATDRTGIDALILSHSDYPHSGNVGAFAPEGEDVELVASSGAPRAQGLPADATTVEIDGELEVAGRQFSFIDPPLADRSHTTWIYDHGSRGLFTADGFGSYHTPGECDYVSSDFEDGIPSERIYAFHDDTLVWLRYVDPEKLRIALESIFDAYSVEYVAPIHGHPIVDEDLEQYLDRLVEAAARIESEYTVPDTIQDE